MFFFFFSFFLVTPGYWCCVVGIACLVIGGYLLVLFSSFLEHLGYFFNSKTRACLLFYFHVSGVYIVCIIAEPWIESLVYRSTSCFHTSMTSLYK